MATNLRRSTNAPNDNMIKFLYIVIKQLDTRPIDWQQVADEIGITNGHAARMRFSRFKQQMEGTYPTRRQPRDVSATKDATPAKRSVAKKAGEGRPKKVTKRRTTTKKVRESDDSSDEYVEPDIKDEDDEGEEATSWTIVKEEPEDEEWFEVAAPGFQGDDGVEDYDVVVKTEMD